MIYFDEVIQRIKEVLTKQKQNTKILDKDIAIALNLNPQYYAVIKKRKKIPYEKISNFSASHKLNMNWILIAQKPRYLT
jgi:hypothetical protein